MVDEILISELQRKCPDRSLKSLIPRAVKILFSIDPGYRNTQPGRLYDRAIGIAAEIKNAPTKKVQKLQEDLSAALMPGALIDAAETIKDIAPQVKKIRKRLFEKEDPPFDSFEKALDWLKQKEKEGQAQWQKFSENQRVEKKIYFLPGPGDKGWKTRIPVFSGSPLEKLETEIRELTERTNFEGFSLIMHMLMGIKPLSISYTATESVGKKPIFEIEIFRELSRKEFLKLFVDMRSFFKAGKKELTEKNLRVYDFVEAEGGKPRPPGVRESWRILKNKWNKNYPKEKYRTPEGLRMAYERILKNRSSQ